MIDLNERIEEIRDLLISPVTDDDARKILALLDEIKPVRATPAPQAAPSDLLRLISEYGDLPADSRGRVGIFAEIRAAIETLAAPAVAITQAATSEPVAYLHQVVAGDGEPDQALSFAPDNFPLANTLGYRSISHRPLVFGDLAGTTPNTEAPSDERAAFEAHFLAMWAKRYPTISHDGLQKRVSRHEDGRYVTDEAECQWNGWQARASLSAQQAGVQEAPSEDAKELPTLDDDSWRAGITAFRAALNEMTGRDGYVVMKTYEAIKNFYAAKKGGA